MCCKDITQSNPNGSASVTYFFHGTLSGMFGILCLVGYGMIKGNVSKQSTLANEHKLYDLQCVIICICKLFQYCIFICFNHYQYGGTLMRAPLVRLPVLTEDTNKFNSFLFALGLPQALTENLIPPVVACHAVSSTKGAAYKKHSPWGPQLLFGIHAEDTG